MTRLSDMLLKARRAVLRKGVASDDADDLVHEAFIKLERYEREHVVRSREAFLVKAAVNLSIDMARRRARSPLEKADFHFSTAAAYNPDPDEILRAQARLLHLKKGVEELPERTQRILIARRLEGLSYKQIAASEQMSVAAVEKHVARATLQLMKWMQGW